MAHAPGLIYNRIGKRLIELLRQFIKAAGIFLRTVWRVTRQTFHEVTGALFTLCAFSGLLGAWRGWQGRQSHWIIGLGILYSAMMGAFATLSFRSARQVR
jgi:hypothetical protein